MPVAQLVHTCMSLGHQEATTVSRSCTHGIFAPMADTGRPARSMFFNKRAESSGGLTGNRRRSTGPILKPNNMTYINVMIGTVMRILRSDGRLC